MAKKIKKKFKRRKLPIVKSYIYHNMTTHLQYLPEDRLEYEEIEEIPDDVQELEWHSKIQPASEGVNSETALSIMVAQAQRPGLSPQEQGIRAQTRATLDSAVMAIVFWNQVEDDDAETPIPITVENLLAFEPPWLFNKILARHTQFNTGKN